MKNILKNILTCVAVMVAGLASAQSCPDPANPTHCFNPPPCDFSDLFYTQNGVDPTKLVGRFGVDPTTGARVREFGPPAPLCTTNLCQPNWVADTNCSANDPTRRDFRILATTGAFAAKYFSIIAFMLDESVFEKNVTFPAGGGTVSFDVNGANPRSYTTQFIISNFLAFAAPKQRSAAGTLAPTPCGSLHDPNLGPDCFTVGKTADGLFAVDTPNLRQDWNIQTLNNAMDGNPSSNPTNPAASDNNCVDQTRCPPPLQDSPFGYFCDDLLGTWLVHYWWFTEHAIGGTGANNNSIMPDPQCTKILCCATTVNGPSLDALPASQACSPTTSIMNTPVIKNDAQLNFLKGVSGTKASAFGQTQTCLADTDLPTVACAADGAISTSGSDGGVVWIICPDLDDPQDGAIVQDSFLDAVRVTQPNGPYLDHTIEKNFNCLQQGGKLCSANPLPPVCVTLCQ